MSLSKKQKIFVAIASCAFFFVALWMWFIAPQLTKLSAGFSYTADIISIDNLYNEELHQYSGEVQSNTTFSYEAEGDSEGALLIKNVFDVRKPSGEQIFAVERHYGVDPRSGAHVAGVGDKSRDGYLFAPQRLNQGDPFTYWHINYDGPAHMRYVGEENLLGLSVFRYETRYEDIRIDQTENLKFLPGVGVTRGIELEPYLELWIEPVTGRMVKYEDHTTAYYYDLTTGERLNPWNQFSNTYTFASVAEQVRIAAQEKQKVFFVETLTPSILSLLAISFLCLFFLRRTGVRFFRMTFLLPTVLASLSLLATYGGWQYMDRAVENTVRGQFEAQASDIENSVENRFRVYLNALLSARGLYAASNEVERDEWRDFVLGINLEQNYPGIRALSFNAYVRSDGLDLFEQGVRNEGLADFAVLPEGEREVYVPITFIEPYEINKGALGFDVFSESVRREALERARDTGEIAMTGAVMLTQYEAGPGFLFFAPVYTNGVSTATENERRSAIKGYIAGVVQIDNFLRGILGTYASSIDVEVFDTPSGVTITDANRLYQSNDAYSVLDASFVPEFRLDKTAEFGGRTWTIAFTSLPGFGRAFAESYVPLLVALGGTIFSVLLFGIIYFFASARTRAIAMAEDMTKQLREEKAKAEATLLSIGDGCVVTNSAGNIVLINRAFETLLGWRESEVQGREFVEIVPMLDEQGKTVPESERLIAKALRQKSTTTTTTTTTTTLQYQRKDGTVFPVAVTVSPILLGGGVAGVVEVFRDITREKEIDRAKTEFISLASHQLRTPLTSLRWFVELVLTEKSGPLNAEQKEFMTEIGESVQRLIVLVRDLLNISRLETGRLSINPEPTDMVALIRGVAKELGPQLQAKRLKLKEQSALETLSVSIDPLLIRQVIMNLLSNALKYTPAEGLITVSLLVDDREITVAVTDSGVGIPQAEQYRIFERFFRASNVLTLAEEGTGLGLYVVKSLVEISGGRSGFESQPGTGSRFWFTLPRQGSPARTGEVKLSI